MSAEHGLVLSGSQGTALLHCEFQRFAEGVVLLHTTSGDLLRRLEPNAAAVGCSVSSVLMSRDCILLVIYGGRFLATFSVTARPLHNQTSDQLLNCATLSRDGEFILVGSERGRVSVLHLFPLQLLYNFQVLITFCFVGLVAECGQRRSQYRLVSKSSFCPSRSRLGSDHCFQLGPQQMAQRVQTQIRATLNERS